MMTAEHAITFDDAGHRYAVDGQPIPSVTQILDACGFGSWRKFSEAAALDYSSALGTAAHMAVALLLTGELDFDSLDPALIGRVDAAQRFIKELGVWVYSVEELVYHPTYRYAGRLDLRCTVAGAPAVVDWKTGVVHPSVAVQLAGYAGCLPDPLTHDRFSVQLRDDGQYRIHRYSRAEHREDWMMFCACATVTNYKAARGIR